jgi:invasion protein IalB
MRSRAFLPAGIFAAGLSIAAAAADTAPTLLGAFSGWSAYQSTTGDGRTCYVMAQPKSSEPKKAVRDPVYFLISDWPRRKARSEMQIIPGYKYKDGTQVTAQVGADKIVFFTQNTTGTGSAWVRDSADETRLVDAMKRGSQVVVTGVSQRGTTTHDTFSLDGISTALDRIHAACGM